MKTSSLLTLVVLQLTAVLYASSPRRLRTQTEYQGLCHSSCKTCLGPLAEDCLECATDYIEARSPSGLTCTQSCLKGLFWDKEANVCNPCSSKCTYGCSGAKDNCLIENGQSQKTRSVADTVRFIAIPKALIALFLSVFGVTVLMGTIIYVFGIYFSGKGNEENQQDQDQMQAVKPVKFEDIREPIESESKSKTSHGLKKGIYQVKFIQTMKSKALAARGLGMEAFLKLDLTANQLFQRRQLSIREMENNNSTLTGSQGQYCPMERSFPDPRSNSIQAIN